MPAGEALAQSKDMARAVRGFSRGAKGIKSHANLVKVDLGKTTAVANGIANIMNVASFVVGQYYMTEISNKLDAMNDNISKIGDFQERQFKSRILSLISLIAEISSFSTEILENDEIRKLKLGALENLKADNTELLGQVNITIDELSQKAPKNYADYQGLVDEFNLLLEYQTVLTSMLEEISKLTYLLGKGGSTSEMCYFQFNKFWEQSVKVRKNLKAWHDDKITALSIDLTQKRVAKSGFDRVVSAPFALIDDDKFGYKPIADGVVQKVTTQTATEFESPPQSEIYAHDVEIIIKDGKYFYLAEKG